MKKPKRIISTTKAIISIDPCLKESSSLFNFSKKNTRKREESIIQIIAKARNIKYPFPK